ncbi:hypothetical protein [Mucilaginibacter sp. 10B2]|uniref:hypothetical protein n=1 Tax=Mucilaginibacter sp. 10B2 TaxID=3048574 RepID=UPI002B234A3B|nr:hypothetical protein [Mucilaginibacter sp. 10B2]MEB0280702.1 hypothetical protein [Mucilaginibacter sp. 10B2]
MTIKEAILKSLDDIQALANYLQIYNHIIEKKYYDFGSKTPVSTVSAILADLIRDGDSRIKRLRQPGETYLYYLTKNESTIGIEILTGVVEPEPENELVKSSVFKKTKTYEERSLHKLLSSYLKNTEIYSKTIFHEQSSNKDANQIWTHPDIVGIKFLNLKNKVSRNFLKTVSRMDTFELTSYELKREIINDTELKKAFFQAVSNSSWANYGYLVAFDFNSALDEEMARLNQSFGIGIIKLSANPYQSKILFQAQLRELDFTTIDKLCKMNREFEKFIEQIEKLMTAEDRYYKSTEKELQEFCDEYFSNDTEFEIYCKERYIPMHEPL